jgi:hypothetical protein
MTTVSSVNTDIYNSASQQGDTLILLEAFGYPKDGNTSYIDGKGREEPKKSSFPNDCEDDAAHVGARHCRNPIAVSHGPQVFSNDIYLHPIDSYTR